MRNQRALGHRHLRRGLGGEDLWSIPVTARSARPRSVSKVITQAQPTPCRRGEPSKRSLLPSAAPRLWEKGVHTHAHPRLIELDCS